MAARGNSAYPFVPKSNAKLWPGQFWAIPLSDGRFACGRVLAIDVDKTYGARSSFVAGLLDWVGPEPPTAQNIAGAPLLEIGNAHVKVIEQNGGAVLGERPLEADGIALPAKVTNYWGIGYPLGRAERRFVEGEPLPQWGRREVKSPLTDEMLKPFAEPSGVVQFSSRLTDEDFGRLADWFREYPNVGLRAYGSYDGSITDLEFLRFFPFVRSFSADALYHSSGTLDGLRHLPEDLEGLTIGSTKRKLDLAILRRFHNLKRLYLEGQTKGIHVLSNLSSLEELTLRSITLPDLSVLVPLVNLLALDIKLGGTKALGLLPRIGKLRYLELWMIRGFTDLTPVGQLPHLRYLFLESLRRAEALPDLSADLELRRVHLQTMRGLKDLRPLTTAPRLEELLLIDMGHLRLEDLRPLARMPQLKAATFALGSLRKNEAAEALLGLKPAEGFKSDWREI